MNTVCKLLCICVLFNGLVYGSSGLSEVLDPDLPGSAAPSFVIADGSGNFFMLNNSTLSGAGSVIGWYYITASQQIMEVLDPNLSVSAQPFSIAVNDSGSFFITNRSFLSGSGGLVGWYYTPGSTIVEITDPDLSGSATPFTIANNSGSFFITNDSVISGADALVGWYYTPGSPLAEVVDPNTVPSGSNPAYIFANSSGNFFITNNNSITGTGALVGWYYTGGSPTAAEVTDPDALTGSAAPYNVFANSSGNFFITNSGNITGANGLVGWYYTAGSSTAAGVKDPNTLTGTAAAFFVVSNSSSNFFISNGNNITGTGGLVGWYYTSGSTTAAEVTDPNTLLASAQPLFVSVNSSGDFFITNNSNITGPNEPVGWYYTSGSTTAAEVTDPDLSSTNAAYAVAVNSGNNFFITNGGGTTSGPNGLVGWYYTSGSTTAAEVTDPDLSGSAEAIYVGVNSDGDFFITNSEGSSGGAAGLVGWSYGTSSSNPSSVRAFRRPNNRRGL